MERTTGSHRLVFLLTEAGAALAAVLALSGAALAQVTPTSRRDWQAAAAHSTRRYPVVTR